MTLLSPQRNVITYALSNELRSWLNSLPWALRAQAYRSLKTNPWSNVPASQNFLFIHVPKTGGTAVTRALGIGSSWHPKLEEYYAHNQAGADNLFKFAFVRNPWDRFVSSFHYTKGRNNSIIEKQWSDRWLGDCDSFSSFLVKLKKSSVFQRVVSVHPMFEPQFKFVQHKQRLCLDYVGKQESLEEDVKHVCELLGRSHPSLEIMNTSKRNTYESYYKHDWEIDLVKKMYLIDIANFNYTFS